MLQTLPHSRHDCRRRRRASSALAVGKVHIVATLVCSAFGLTPEQLYAGSRGVARIAFARQVAMYIAHVWLGLSLSEVGRRFGRDRTTVAYACEVIEDRREDPSVDSMLNVMESAASSWQDLVIERGGTDRGMLADRPKIERGAI